MSKKTVSIFLFIILMLSGCSTRVYPDTMDNDTPMKPDSGITVLDVKF